MFRKKLMLIKEANQKSAIFLIIGFFLNKGFKFQPCVWNRCHDLLMTSMNLNDIVILKIKNTDHFCITEISKSEAIKLLQNIDLTEKSGTL